MNETTFSKKFLPSTRTTSEFKSFLAPPNYYAIFPLISFKSSIKRSLQYPLFFNSSSSNFNYQLKTLRSCSINLLNPSLPQPQQILSKSFLTLGPSLFSQLTDMPITQFSSLPSNYVDPLPCVLQLPIFQYPDLLSLFERNKSQENQFFDYVQGQLYEYGITVPKNIEQALQIYTKGSLRSSLGCLIKLIRISIEPELAEMFQQSCDPVRALNLFLHIFQIYGLFDRFTSPNHSISQFALFNLYMDIFPDFKALVLEASASELGSTLWNERLASKTGIEGKAALRTLLNLLGQEDTYKKESIRALQDLTELSKENNILASFLLGDLLDTSFFGISALHDLDRRLSLYCKAEASGISIAAERLVCLFETLQQYLVIKHAKTDHTQQNLDLYHNKLENMSTVEIYRKLASDILMENGMELQLDRVRELYEILFYIGDRRIEQELFSLLKYLRSPNLATIVGYAMQEYKSELVDILRGHCLEKGIGETPDQVEALKIYQEILRKPTFGSSYHLIEVLYRISATIRKTTEGGQADFFTRLCIFEILKWWESNPPSHFVLYAIYKILYKRNGVTSSVKSCQIILKGSLQLKTESQMEKIMYLYSKRAYEKMEKLKPSRYSNGRHIGNNEDATKEPFHKEVLKVTEGFQRELEASVFNIYDKEKLNDPKFMKEIILVRLSDVIASLTRGYEDLFAKLRDNWDNSPSVKEGEGLSFEKTPQSRTSVIDLTNYTPTHHSLLKKSSDIPPQSGAQSEVETSQFQGRKALRRRLRSVEAHNSASFSSSLSFVHRAPSTKASTKGEIFKYMLSLRENIQNLLESHKTNSYNVLAQGLYVPEKRKPVLSFLKAALDFQRSAMTDSNGHRKFEVYQKEESEMIHQALLGLLEGLANDNKVRCLKETAFTLTEGAKPKYKTAIFNQNSQMFDVIVLEYPISYVLSLIQEKPLVFLVPAVFNHPQFIFTYGISFMIVNSTLQVLYFMEPKEQSLKHLLKHQASDLGFRERLMILQQILRILQAIHIHGVPFFNLDLASFVVSLDGQIKLKNIFLPLLEGPGKSEYLPNGKTFYRGSLERLPIDIFKGDGRMSTSSDIFCFGMIMFEVLAGRSICKADDFQSDTEYLEKVGNGLLNQRVLHACRKGILMQPNPKHYPSFIDDTIISCISIDKKKRPKVSSLLLTFHQVLLGPSSVQEDNKNKKVLNSSANFGKSLLRWSFESSFTADDFIKQQYRAVKFAQPVDEQNISMVLPGMSSYKGPLKDRLPYGEGELAIMDIFCYVGNFYEGAPHGYGKADLFRREENIVGKFWRGFPIESVVSNQSYSLKLSFEEGSWIPVKEYRPKMLDGFKVMDPQFLENILVQEPRLLENSKNKQLINSYVDFISRSGVYGDSKAQLVDCFGNFYYFPGGFVPQIAPSSLIVKKIGMIELSMRVYKAKLSMDTMFGVDLSAMDLVFLREKGKNPIKSCYQGNYEQISKYFHFGCKYHGRMEGNKLIRGVVYMNYNDYFWYDGCGNVYNGGKYGKINKCLYIGDIFQNKAEGLGIEYIGSEKRYEGEYINGKPHGKGISYNEYGMIEFRGIFNEGKPLYGFYYEGKRTYEGIFQEITRKASLKNLELEELNTLQDQLGPLKTEESRGLRMSFMDKLAIQPDTCRCKPILFSISPQESKYESLILDDEDENKGQKTEFEGTVRNFSQNILELQGRFVIDDRNFNGKFKIRYADGSMYNGELINGVREGNGLYVSANGVEFEGLWKSGSLKGKIRWNKGSKKIEYSEGEFIKEQSGEVKQSGFGRMKFKNGDYYEGEFKSGVMEGFGILWEASGRVFEGSMKNGKKDGMGRIWENRERSCLYYEGEFKEGRKEGIGILYKEGKKIFKGRFLKDKPKAGQLSGTNSLGQVKNFTFGEEKWSYYGEVQESQTYRVAPDGWGVAYCKDKVIKGVFMNGQLKDNVGLVTYNSNDNVDLFKQNEAEYFGEIINGLENGLGMRDYIMRGIEAENQEEEGNIEDKEEKEEKEKMERYEGQWVNGVRKGFGRIWYMDDKGNEKLYRGEVYDQREGFGEWRMQMDVYYHGEFRDNKRDGNGILYKKEKQILGIYEKGSIQRMIYNDNLKMKSK